MLLLSYALLGIILYGFLCDEEEEHHGEVVRERMGNHYDNEIYGSAYSYDLNTGKVKRRWYAPRSFQ